MYVYTRTYIDTIDQDVLFSGMESTLGITGPVIDLSRSYISDRTLPELEYINSYATKISHFWY